MDKWKKVLDKLTELSQQTETYSVYSRSNSLVSPTVPKPRDRKLGLSFAPQAQIFDFVSMIFQSSIFVLIFDEFLLLICQFF